MRPVKISFSIALQLIAIFLFSLATGWSFMESFFLGSLGMFGLVWLFRLNKNLSANERHISPHRWGGIATSEVKPFQMQFDSYLIGSLLLLAVSFIVTIIYYLPYFI
ncbi:hypothetical protein [Bacillus manliponensis]|uniref:hypothetical protein n=1 Tax=Bacillus manliponensis TaxID=574376 RepID=UPI003511BA2B